MQTEVPYMAMHRNLAWTRSGAVWAGWRVKGLAYAGRSVEEKTVVANMHRLLWRTMPAGESLAMGLVTNTSPASVVKRMLSRIPEQEWGQYGGWLSECEATLDTLEDIPLGRRSGYLFLPLSNAGWDAVREPARAALGRCRTMLNLPPARITPEQVEHRLHQADMVLQRLPAPFQLTPVSVAELVWIWQHAASRLVNSFPFEPNDETRALPASSRMISAPVIDVGGQSEFSRDERRRTNPLTNRFLKVTSPEQIDAGLSGASYQSMVALCGFPPNGVVFPGSEYLGRMDEADVLGVDWAVRIRKVARESALRKTAAAVAKINDQYDQREQAMTTGHHALDESGRLLSEYQQILENDPNEAEINHTTIIAVPGVDGPSAEAQAKKVQSWLSTYDFRSDRPIGSDQERLWTAMMPGVPAGLVTRSYEQRTTTGDLALAVPFVDATMGDSEGVLLGLNTMSPGLVSPLFVDVFNYSRSGRAANIAMTGVMGSGKSACLKTLALAIAMQGAQVLAIDRTPECEWGRLEKVIPGTAAIIDPVDPHYTMDALRTLGLAAGAEVQLDFLTCLTGLGPNTPLGANLALAMDPGYLGERGIGSTLAFLEHLESAECRLEGAKDLATRIRVHASRSYARVVFDRDLPIPPLDGSLLVFRTSGLELPLAQELEHEHQFAQMRGPKLFGRAYYALLMALTRKMAYLDRSRLTVQINDEASYVTSSPEAERAATEMLRESRRANCAIWAASQLATDLGSGEFRALFATRFAFRQADRAAAEASVEYLGFKPEDPQFAGLVQALVEDTSPVDPSTGKVMAGREGEAWIRCSNGSAGWAKVLLPSLPEHRAACLSDPPAQAKQPVLIGGGASG